MNNFIYKPLTDKSDYTESVLYYCVKDLEDYLDDNENPRQNQEDTNTMAKCFIVENKNHYMIKTTFNNELYNPISKFDTEKSYSFLNNVTKPIDKFINVNKNVFYNYLKFLSTKNILWLKKAERERS